MSPRNRRRHGLLLRLSRGRRLFWKVSNVFWTRNNLFSNFSSRALEGDRFKFRNIAVSSPAFKGVVWICLTNRLIQGDIYTTIARCRSMTYFCDKTNSRFNFTASEGRRRKPDRL
ncbi:hypothetical protein PJP10_31100, partial [Mycobacterium kansasii]